MRVFFCTFLSARNQETSDGAVNRLVAASAGLLRPVPRGTVHVTYAFIPDVGEDAVMAMLSAVSRQTGQRSPFEMILGEPSILYAGREARLVHAPIAAGARELSQLTIAIGQAIRTAIPEVTFKPTASFHVTLARFRRGTRRVDADGLKAALAVFPRRLTNPVHDIQLVSSELTPAGPKYTTLGSMALASSAGESG